MGRGRGKLPWYVAQEQYPCNRFWLDTNNVAHSTGSGLISWRFPGNKTQCRWWPHQSRRLERRAGGGAEIHSVESHCEWCSSLSGPSVKEWSVSLWMFCICCAECLNCDSPAPSRFTQTKRAAVRGPTEGQRVAKQEDEEESWSLNDTDSRLVVHHHRECNLFCLQMDTGLRGVIVPIWRRWWYSLQVASATA